MSLLWVQAARPVVGDPIQCDVSAWNEAEPRIEVHRLGGHQDGSRRLPDGSHTGGLGITACGIEQATRGHGWYAIYNDYQRQRIRHGKVPLCDKCGVTMDEVLK